MRSWGKQVLRYLLILIIMAIGFVACAYWWAKPPVSFNANRFNKKVWTATKGLSATWSCRWQMADDLQKRRLTPGMEDKEIIKLLGEPDAGKSKKLYKYNLGDWGPLSPFPVYYTLDVFFDYNGHMYWTERTRHKGKAENVGAKKSQSPADIGHKLGDTLRDRNDFPEETDKEPTGEN